MYVYVGARSIRFGSGQHSVTLLWYHGDHPDQEGGLSSQVPFPCLFIKVSNTADVTEMLAEIQLLIFPFHNLQQHLPGAIWQNLALQFKAK